MTIINLSPPPLKDYHRLGRRLSSSIHPDHQTHQPNNSTNLKNYLKRWEWLNLITSSTQAIHHQQQPQPTVQTDHTNSNISNMDNDGDGDGDGAEEQEAKENEGIQSAHDPLPSSVPAPTHDSINLPTSSTLVRSPSPYHHRFPNPKLSVLRIQSHFTSSNVYLRPLPSSFTPIDLHRLCMSMVQPSACPISPQNGGIQAEYQLLNPSSNFTILSVKVMIEEDDQSALGTCKGFGFCLWNSVEASTRCIQALRAHGYQASYARESSRGMLSSLADPTSANLYLSNLPHHWGEEELRALFGKTPIASARLLRDRDDEAVGTGASRGVGFVRLSSRSDALHYVELLHGMPITGTNSHLQCRMADSQAQKEWKRNLRSSSFRSLPVKLAIESPPPTPHSIIQSSRSSQLDSRTGSPPHSRRWTSGTNKKPGNSQRMMASNARSESNKLQSDRRQISSIRSSTNPFETLHKGSYRSGSGSGASPPLPPPLPPSRPSISPNRALDHRLHSSPLTSNPGGNDHFQPIFPIGPPTLFPVYPSGGWYPSPCGSLNLTPGGSPSSSSLPNTPHPPIIPSWPPTSVLPTPNDGYYDLNHNNHPHQFEPIVPPDVSYYHHYPTDPHRELAHQPGGYGSHSGLMIDLAPPPLPLPPPHHLIDQEDGNYYQAWHYPHRQSHRYHHHRHHHSPPNLKAVTANPEKNKLLEAPSTTHDDHGPEEGEEEVEEEEEDHSTKFEIIE